MFDLKELCEVSARLGADRLLVQGPGGNTSLKIADRLWVKASGRWLSEASERPIFVPLALTAVRAALAAGNADAFEFAIVRDRAEPGLRPSIETALHALMPHRAVIHAHAVNSMATAVLANGRARAARALDGVVSWAWIDYRRPGIALADAVAHAMAGEMRDVLVLQNHGVVVGADTLELAEVRLRDVERLLELPLRLLTTPSADHYASHESPAYEALVEVSGLAFDAELIRIVTTGALVPDQVVFLGGAVPACAPGETVEAAARRTQSASGVAPALVLLPGVAAFAARERSQGADSLIAALFEIARRIPHGAEVHALPADAISELLGWEAEQYRLTLDPARC
ncbi:MAG: class II aldolase/adducin family protein [Pseudomonadota bacterium]|nr:class II aldolase/adducin family protein [Pseudomonadota bacterium]